MNKSIFVLLMLLLIPGQFQGLYLSCEETASSSDVDYVTNVGNEASMNWTKQVMSVKGNGFGPESVKELGRRKILAKRAAKLDAYRNLVEAIKGVHVTANTRVEEMMLASDNIKTKTEGMLKGMQIIDVSYSDDGGCEVTVEVNINEKGQFLLSALNAGEIKLKDDYPKFDWVTLRNEWAAAKDELANTQKTLERTNEELYSTQYALSNKEEELKQIKTQFAALKQDFNKTKEQLFASNMDMTRMEEKLKHANLAKNELKAAFVSATKELNNTSSIVKRLKNILDDDIFQLAVEDKGLSRTRDHLSQEEKDLDKLQQELKIYGENDMLEQPGNGKLLEYVQRTKEIQQRTTQGLQDFTEMPAPGSLPIITQDFSGLLIDARGFPLKQVLAPSILTEKKEKLYGLGVIPTTLGNDAIAAYLSGDIEKAKKHSKIGNQPLVIKPVQVANECDVIINDDDVKKLASLYELLEQQKVAIMI